MTRRRAQQSLDRSRASLDRVSGREHPLLSSFRPSPSPFLSASSPRSRPRPALVPASGAGSGAGRHRLPVSGPSGPHSPETPGQRAPRPRPIRPGQARVPGSGPPPRAMEPRPPGSRRMDPVQKAVLSHTFGGPLLKTKRPIISCNVCQIRFNSQSQAEAHYKGNRHARRVKGIEAAKTRGREPGVREPGDPAPPSSTPANGDGVAPRPVSTENGLGPAPGSPEKQPGSPSPPSMPETGQGATKGEGVTLVPASLPGGSKEEEEKAKRLLYCALCKVAVNSLSQLEAHNKGTKHKTILEARSGLGPIKAYPRLGPPTPGEPDSPAQDRTFHCEICNVKVNSEVQLKQHISSRRHRDGVAGKPNPLLSRHKKPRGAGELAGTLTFSKELPKPLAGGLLPSPLAVAAVMAAAAGSPLSLRPAPAAPLLQGPPITHPLLHPAPGPIRTAHGPILFSPY
ncbi:zinc finger protein 385A isoform X2 [Manis pentadactyla]|uniref:zinc finger protein 385A isoform X2 n=2 Tax=Manis pentadactyla TaxID=143292 RepID=UPI00255CF22F|nr:zinc finger protein 385A isoform X2 [Manis pentadactyla]